jgi:hypothetical protein
MLIFLNKSIFARNLFFAYFKKKLKNRQKILNAFMFALDMNALKNVGFRWIQSELLIAFAKFHKTFDQVNPVVGGSFQTF